MSRAHIHLPANIGDKVADSVVSAMGSWRFIIIQTCIVTLWISANLWFLAHPYDPYPFILLNLLFSTQAAYASPLILMAANRSAQRDKARDDLEAQEVDELFTINKEQKEILELQTMILNQQSEILEALKHE